MLPITLDQFLAVFVTYNEAVWPAQVLAYLLGLLMVVFTIWPSNQRSRVVATGLAVMWLWTGVAYLQPVRAILEPLDIGMFAGKIDLDELGFFAKFVLKAMRKKEGDWRDWEAVHDWAGKIYARLERDEVAP